MVKKKEEHNGRVLIHSLPQEEAVLRSKAKEFEFTELSLMEIRDLVVHMRSVMRKARGVGLSANQIGLPYRLFVAEVPDGHGSTKFYAIFNPKLEKLEDKELMDEGCLSVPGVYGQVERYEKLILKGQDAKGKPVKIKAWGLLAQVFQHELGHLNGELFIDKAKQLYEVVAQESARKK